MLILHIVPWTFEEAICRLDQGVLGRSGAVFSVRKSPFVGHYKLCNFADCVDAQTDTLHPKGRGKH